MSAETFPKFGRFKGKLVGRNRPEEIRRENRSSRGYDSAWERLRNRFLKANPFCRFCGQEGREVALATTVDHIIPVEAAPELRLRWDNLQALCDSHHFGTKGKLERIARQFADVKILRRWSESKEERDAILSRANW